MKTLRNPLMPLSARLVATGLLVAAAGAFTLTVHAAPGAGMEGRSGHHAAGMGMPMMGHPQQIERLLDSVNATADQRSQIKAIVQAAAADMKAQRASGMALHEQSRALFTQPTVDARAAEALRAQMSAQHDQASKRGLQVMLDISRVLTPDQRKLLADRMAQRRSMMERHRAERDAMDSRSK